MLGKRTESLLFSLFFGAVLLGILSISMVPLSALIFGMVLFGIGSFSMMSLSARRPWFYTTIAEVVFWAGAILLIKGLLMMAKALP